MSITQVSGFRLKLFRVLEFFVPEGSSLDAVFNSYDDWRRFRAHSSQPRPVTSSTEQPSEGSSASSSATHSS
jgi:hypothetical protein